MDNLRPKLRIKNELGRALLAEFVGTALLLVRNNLDLPSPRMGIVGLFCFSCCQKTVVSMIKCHEGRAAANRFVLLLCCGDYEGGQYL